ncbi:MAG: hypothetical protein ACM3QS_12370 [Bacteroidota bacterium]
MATGFPSATELVHQVITELKPFTEMLPPQDRLIFGKLTEYALNSRAAIVDTGSLLPLEATLLILLLEEHKRIQRLYSELCAEIERLQKAAQRLDSSAQAAEGSS